MICHNLWAANFIFMQMKLCLICTGKDIKMIEDQLNEDFNSLCERFIDNKLSINFGEEKN